MFSSLFYVCLVLSTLGCSLRPKHDLQGSITVVGTEFQTGRGQDGKVDDDCYTWGGYADIAKGMEVLVKNGEGKTLAIGRLSGGKFTKVDTAGYRKTCTFSFSVQNIPKTEFYVVDAGRRGEKQYSFSELQELDWKLEYLLNQ